MNYYKIIGNPPKIGSIINTENNVNNDRINRYSKLTKIFTLIYELSRSNDLPIINILSTLFPKLFPHIQTVENTNLKIHFDIITRELLVTKFQVNTEWRYFNDFVLEKARKDISNEFQLALPNRFRSQFFFESINDCVKYYFELNQKSRSIIIEVQFFETIHFHKVDNRLVTNFYDYYTSNDYYNQAKNFLLQDESSNPLFEIVYQGKYKVLSHHSLNI